MRKLLLLLLPPLCYGQNFPNSIFTRLVAKDNVSAALLSGMQPSDNVAIIRSGSGWTPNMLAYICDSSTSTVTCTGSYEIMLVTAVNTNVLTVTRAQGGTSAIAHAAGRTISNAPVSVYHKTLADEMYAVESTLGTSMQHSASYPSISSNWADFWRDVGGFPSGGLFGGGTVPLPEAIRGSISIPGTDSSPNHAAGVAGYSMSASNTRGAVGVFGVGLPAADGVSTWGGNFITNNCMTPWTSCSGTNNGRNIWTGYGVEIDLSVYRTSGGVPPSHFVSGIYIVNAGDIDATGAAIRMDNPITPYPKISQALLTSDGFSDVFATIGTIGTGNNVSSQSLVFRARDSGGTLRTARIIADSSGNMVINPGSGALAVLEDGAGNQALQIAPNGSTPYVNVVNALYDPSIKSTTGTRYVCVDSSGKFVSSTSACSGT